MTIEDDDEIERLLEKKKRNLLNKLREAESKKNKISSIQTKEVLNQEKILSFLSPAALNYLKKKKNEDWNGYNRLLTAVSFLIREGLIEPKISLDAILFIAKRLMLEESKIFVEREGRLEEI